MPRRVRIHSFLVGLAFVCIALTVLLGPLAFGAVEPWAYSLMAILSYTALMAALTHGILTGGLGRLRVPALSPALLGLALVCAQFTPWPVQLLRVVSPRTVSLHALTAPPLAAATPYLSPSL